MKAIAGFLCLAFAGSITGLAQTLTPANDQTISVTMTGASSSWSCTFNATSFSFDLHTNGSAVLPSGTVSVFDTTAILGKIMDPCSAVLAKAAFLGERYATVKIRASAQQTATSSMVLFRVFNLSGVVLSSISSTLSGTVPNETLTLDYQTIIIGEPQNGIQYGWQRTNSLLGAEILPTACSNGNCN
jgi:type VI protein secretion system component Hcp